MRTERITFLATPQFKTLLARQAERDGISVAELVRRRFEQPPAGDEETLRLLAVEVRQAVKDAKASLENGLGEASRLLTQLQAQRALREKQAQGARGKRKAAQA